MRATPRPEIRLVARAVGYRPATRRPAPAFGLAIALLVVGAVACDGGAKPAPNTAASSAEVGEQATFESGRKKLAQAIAAINAKEYGEARELLRAVSALGVESLRFDVERATEKLDKKEARLWAGDAIGELDKKPCTGAFKRLAAPIEKLGSETFARELRRLIHDKALQCARAQIDEATAAGKLADARAFVDATDTRAVLGSAWTQVSADLGATLADALRAAVASDIKAKQWAVAVGKIDDAVKKGDASDTESAPILGGIREAIAQEIKGIAEKGIEGRDAAGALKQVDGMIDLVHWQSLAPGEATATPADVTPADVALARATLATWAEAQRINAKPLPAREKRWTYGTIALRPAPASDGEPKQDLKPSTEVWIIAETKDRALVASDSPGSGSLGAALVKAIGWAPLARLAREATIDWVAPDDQLKGTLVWGPLRPPDATYELGTVSEVKGQDVMVKRVADDKVIQVARKSLRSGRFHVGAKMLTFCTAKDQPATVSDILPAGRGVILKCDASGTTKEELLPSLRTKPEFLPASKQP